MHHHDHHGSGDHQSSHDHRGNRDHHGTTEATANTATIRSTSAARAMSAAITTQSTHESSSMTAAPVHAEQAIPYPAPEDCPKRGGSGACSRECRVCPNRGL